MSDETLPATRNIDRSIQECTLLGVQTHASRELKAIQQFARQQAAKVGELEADNVRLKQVLGWMATAPDSQVSSFVRAACMAVLDGGTGEVPPGDALKTIAELEAEVERLRAAMRVACNLLVDAWPGDVRDAHGILDAALAVKGDHNG